MKKKKRETIFAQYITVIFMLKYIPLCVFCAAVGCN